MPLLYILGFRGQLRTVLGTIVVTDRATLRASIYGAFKTYFCSMRSIALLVPSHLCGTVVDVGANMGDFTLAMAERRPARIVALEPGAENFAALRSNMVLNGFSDAILLNLAAHDCEEIVQMHGTNSNLHVDSSSNGFPAQGVSLDCLMVQLGIEEIDILKLDVQGHEWSVLMGMECLLRREAIRFLLMEVHTKRNVALREIVSTMHTYGYRLAHTDPYLFKQPQLCFIPNGGSVRTAQSTTDA